MLRRHGLVVQFKNWFWWETMTHTCQPRGKNGKKKGQTRVLARLQWKQGKIKWGNNGKKREKVVEIVDFTGIGGRSLHIFHVKLKNLSYLRTQPRRGKHCGNRGNCTNSSIVSTSTTLRWNHARLSPWINLEAKHQPCRSIAWCYLGCTHTYWTAAMACKSSRILQKAHMHSALLHMNAN